jgi:lipooligosaccharide transport system permease protein
VLAVIAVSGFFVSQPLITSPLFLLVPVIAFFGGLMFSGIAMCFTAVAPNIDFFNYPIFLFVTPMLFLSGTFFPLSSLPEAAQGLALVILPLTHIVNLTRGAMTGSTEVLFGLNTQTLIPLSIVWIVVVMVVFFIVSIT